MKLIISVEYHEELEYPTNIEEELIIDDITAFKKLHIFDEDSEINIPIILTENGYKYMLKYIKTNFPIYDELKISKFVMTTEPNISHLSIKCLYSLSKLAEFIGSIAFIDLIFYTISKKLENGIEEFEKII